MPYNSSKMIFFSVFAYLIFLVRISLQYPTLTPPPISAFTFQVSTLLK